MLPPDVLPEKLVCEESCGTVAILGGEEGGRSLRVHVQPGRQKAWVIAGVEMAAICNVGEGHEKNRAVNGRAYGKIIDNGKGDGLASISRFQTSASKESWVSAESVRRTMM